MKQVIQKSSVEFNSLTVHKSDCEEIQIFENRNKSGAEITIAIPTFNRVDTLYYALKSALNQDYDNFEIIVVDNNPESGTATESLLMQYKHIPNLSYFKNKVNIGLYGNWNMCFKLSRTPYITLLHDDDYLFPSYLSKMMKCLKKYPKIDCLSCNHVNWIEDEHSDSIENVDDYIANKVKNGIYKVPYNLFFYLHAIGPVGVVYKKNCYESLGGFNPQYYPISDYIFHYLYARKFNVYGINEDLMYYRKGRNISIRPENIVKQEVENLRFRMKLAKESMFPCIKAKIARTLYDYNLKNLHSIYPDYKIRFKYNDYVSKYNLFLFWGKKRIYLFFNLYRKVVSKLEII